MADATRGPGNRYHGLAIALHWTVAALVVAVLATGLSLDDLDEGAERLARLDLHRSLGIAILFLTLVRLGWRLAHPPPPPLAAPVWALRASKLVHGAFYVILLGLPLGGWLATSARGREVVVFGLAHLPAIVAPDRGLARLATQVHAAGQFPLYLLLALHVGAALWHQAMLKDRILGRMGLGRV